MSWLQSFTMFIESCRRREWLKNATDTAAVIVMCVDIIHVYILVVDKCVWCARRGTMDVSTTKLLSIHISALLPPTSTELDVPHIVKVAAVLGIGLVYQGTAHRHIAEVLLSEIGQLTHHCLLPLSVRPVHWQNSAHCCRMGTAIKHPVPGCHL